MFLRLNIHLANKSTRYSITISKWRIFQIVFFKIYRSMQSMWHSVHNTIFVIEFLKRIRATSACSYQKQECTQKSSTTQNLLETMHTTRHSKADMVCLIAQDQHTTNRVTTQDSSLVNLFRKLRSVLAVHDLRKHAYTLYQPNFDVLSSFQWELWIKKKSAGIRYLLFLVLFKIVMERPWRYTYFGSGFSTSVRYPNWKKRSPSIWQVKIHQWLLVW